jgi:hypothetical protein
MCFSRPSAPRSGSGVITVRFPKLVFTVAVLLILAAMGMRVWWAYSVTPRPISDAAWYWNQAVRMADGGNYGSDAGPTAYRPVGYSAALAPLIRVFGTDTIVARLFNALLSVATLTALFGLTRRLTMSNGAGLVVLVLYGAFPADIGYTSLPLSELFFNALAVCAVYVFNGNPRSLIHGGVAGTLIALAALTRPQGGLLFFIVIVALLGTAMPLRRKVLCVAAISCAMTLTLLPWTIRNAYVFHSLVPISTNGGINMFIGNNPEATGCYSIPKNWKAELDSAVPGALDKQARELASDRYASSRAIEFIKENPRKALALWRPKLRCLFRDEGAFAHFSRKIPAEQQPLLARLTSVCQRYYETLLALACLGSTGMLACAFARKTRRPELQWLPAAVVAGFVLVTLVTFGDARFHHPIMPWASIYAASFLSCAFRFFASLARHVLHVLKLSTSRSPEPGP